MKTETVAPQIIIDVATIIGQLKFNISIIKTAKI